MKLFESKLFQIRPFQMFSFIPRNPGPPIKPLAQRCLELTAFFETSQRPPECYGRAAGNFDSQVLSVGALQWNLGQQTLQPMLRALVDVARKDVIEIMGHTEMLTMDAAMGSPLPEQLRWGQSLQDNRNRLRPSVVKMFRRLGELPVWQQIQVDAAMERYTWAVHQCPGYHVHSERAVALFFDIRVQNGSIPSSVREVILSILDREPTKTETWRLMIIAEKRAKASNPRWVQDVLSRKLTIARGHGTVHGHTVNLEDDFDITDNPATQVSLLRRQDNRTSSGAVL